MVECGRAGGGDTADGSVGTPPGWLGRDAPLRSLLFSHSESEEEGTRNVVAECLGRLTLLHPAKYLPELQVGSGGPPGPPRGDMSGLANLTPGG